MNIANEVDNFITITLYSYITEKYFSFVFTIKLPVKL